MSKSYQTKDELIKDVKEGMEKSIRSLQADLQKLRTGRASPSILDDVRVNSYGSQMQLSKVATVAAPEARLITVNPFDTSLLSAIEKAILVAGLGLTPFVNLCNQNDDVQKLTDSYIKKVDEVCATKEKEVLSM